MFDVVSFGLLPVSDGEGISTWRREWKLSLARPGKASMIHAVTALHL